MREDGLKVEVGEYCLHKTIDYYYLSRDKLEEDISRDYDDAIIVQIILKKKNAPLQSSAY